MTRIRAGNQLSGDARTLGFGSGASLVETDGDVEVSFGGSITYVGAASGDTTGVTDTAAIQAALTAVASAGGGIVALAKGVYWLNAGLTMSSYVTLQGAGRYATILKFASGVGSTVNMLSLASARQEQIHVRDLCLHGNDLGQHGVYLLNDSVTNGAFASGFLNPRHRISNVLIAHMGADGFHDAGDANGGALEVTGVQTYFCAGVGFYTLAPDSVFTDCDAGQSGLYGFQDDSGYNRFVGCKAWLSGRVNSTIGDGFRVSGVGYSKFVGCEAQDNQNHGFNFFGRTGIVASGCTADTNSKAGAGTYLGVNLTNATACVVQVECFDRRGDSGTDTVVQTFGATVTGGSKNIVVIGGGTNSTGPLPAADFLTDNTIIATGVSTSSFEGVSRIPHTEASHLDSNEPATGPTRRVLSMRRRDASASVALVNGTVFYTYFTSPIDLTIAKLNTQTRGTAQSGATLARMGLYTVDASGNLTLVAACASDTALWNGTFGNFERALSTGGSLPASYALKAASRYAFAVLHVGTTTAAVLYGASLPGTVTGWDPVECKSQSGQTDLPTSVAVGSLAASGNEILAALYA